MLFWAEGSRSRNRIEFVNSDPAMVRFFLRFLRSCYEVTDSRVTVTCNLFADHEARQREVEDFWLSTLALRGRNCARARSTGTRSTVRKRRNKLPYGTCRVAVCDTALVQNLYGVIQEYGGFEREEWLM